jgi:hypothetical protein
MDVLHRRFGQNEIVAANRKGMISGTFSLHLQNDLVWFRALRHNREVENAFGTQI